MLLEDSAFCERMRRIRDTWGAWHADDQAQQLVKRAIDAIP